MTKNTRKSGKWWICKCSCGNIGSINAYILRSGRSTQCKNCRSKISHLTHGKYVGKSKKSKKVYEDLVGKKFGCWTVLKFMSKNPRVWECQCECGRKQNVLTFNLKHKVSSRCRECLIKMSTKDPFEIFYNRLIGRNKSGRQQVSSLITIEFLRNLFNTQDGKCALSGIPIFITSGSRDGKTTASIDRIDNTKSYTIDNIQLVHKDINYMKWKHEQNYFIEMCTKIALNNKKCLPL